MTDYTWVLLIVEGVIVIAGFCFLYLAYKIEKGLKINQRKRRRNE